MSKPVTACGAVISDSRGRILLLNHVKLGQLTLPIGKADDDEERIGTNTVVASSLIREMREELGIDITDLTILFTVTLDSQYLGKTVRFITSVFKVNSYEGSVVNMEPQKHSSLVWMNMDALLKLDKSLLTDTTNAYLDRVRNKTISI